MRKTFKQGTTVELYIGFTEGNARLWETEYVTVPDDVTSPDGEYWSALFLKEHGNWRNTDIDFVGVYNITEPGDE